MIRHYQHPDPWLRGKLRSVCRQMRKEPTPSEALLWHRLRKRQLRGYKFRRHHPVERFIVDFCCPRAALIIEIDSEVHQNQIESDLEREQILTGLGYRVIRFTNVQVLNQTDHVLQTIGEALSEKSSINHRFLK